MRLPRYFALTLAVGVCSLGTLGAVFSVQVNTTQGQAIVHDAEMDAALDDAAAIPVTQPEATSTEEKIRVPILIYHTASPDRPGITNEQIAFSVTPQILEAQLAYLSDHGYTAISMDELVHDIAVGTTSPVAKPIVLTFDDGWESQYAYAFPLLKKYHMTATFFIYPNPIGRDPRFMTWDQVRELRDGGMTIGDHTYTHPYLSKLTPAQLTHEVVGSKTVLEQELGQPVTHFASPFGYTSDALVSLLKSAGYVSGRTTYPGASHSQEDQFALTGFLVHRDLRDFEWMVAFAK